MTLILQKALVEKDGITLTRCSTHLRFRFALDSILT